ncbi:MAG: hypothetical protein AABW50_05600 [Nanoarchaeota archaeon]
MKERVKKEFKVPFWIVDGFVGILALMIYNFLLYLLALIGVKGIIESMYETMGYFGLNSFIAFGLSPDSMALGILIVFAVSFLLGAEIGKRVRNKIKN